MDVIICSVTRNKNVQDTVLWKSLQKFDIEYNIHYNKDNKGLCELYNEFLDTYKHKDSIVFIHDDVDIINKDIVYQLTEAFKFYDIVGVAGCVNPRIIEKNLWHWMAGDIKNCRGIAGHPASNKNFYISSFGNTPDRVSIIDGVFIAVNTKKLLNSGSKFDNQFKFHHYDIDFCLTCNKNKLTIGVWPILINHQSPGLKDFDSKFEESNRLFLNKWKNK